MGARTPEEAHHLWAQAFSAGDLDGLVALYEPDAVLLPGSGQPVTGRSAIREALRGFLALEARFELRVQRALQADDLALLYSRWTLSATGPDGSDLKRGGQTSDVVRRQSDGTWLFVIDNPYGCAGIEAASQE